MMRSKARFVTETAWRRSVEVVDTRTNAMGDITLEELSAKIADRAQPLRDKVLTVIYALQFEGGGGPVRASEIQQLLAMAEFDV